MNDLKLFIEFISIHRKELESEKSWLESLTSIITTKHNLGTFYTLQLKFIFTDYRNPDLNNAFGNCISLLRDLEKRKFSELFDRVFPGQIDENGLKILSKYYSPEFLHRV